MTIVLSTPTADGAREAMAALREWQHDEAPMQLHPGDIGWNYRFGTAETHAVLRTWSRDGHILAVAMQDSPTLVRMSVAPDAFHDEDLARRLVQDFSLPERGVLPEGTVSVEAPQGLLLHDLLTQEGWDVDDPWTPLFRDLAEPVEDPGVRIEEIGLEHAQDFADVLRSAFNSTRPTREYRHRMSAAPFHADARCLGIYDDQGNPGAVVTVWSAGPGNRGWSSRWVSTPSTAATATAGRSPSPGRPPCGSWARQACVCARRAPTSAASRRTRRPGSRRGRRSPTGFEGHPWHRDRQGGSSDGTGGGE